MIYVCFAEAAVIAGVVFAFCGLLRSSSRAHARREDLLVNQLLHAVGRDWQPAPADAREPVEPREPQERTWTPSPEQEAVY